MDTDKTEHFKEKIANEIDFARAVTAVMMAVKADVSDLEVNRAALRLNSNYKSFESDADKRAS